MKALTRTDFNFEGQKSVYHGKVRDVYNINDDIMVMVATDRISAFDVILPKGIPYKGQVLNQIAAKFLDATSDICPNWKLATPDPMVTVGLKCEGFRVEMIIRSILTGSAWREYKRTFPVKRLFVRVLYLRKTIKSWRNTPVVSLPVDR